MNGGYPDPSRMTNLPMKRQFRDPYGEWWDPQERRNYGEPVHEDNDILGIFSPEAYTHFTPQWGAVLVGTFAATVLGVCVLVKGVYPDTPAVPRIFAGGLEKELGGPNAVRATMNKADQDAILSAKSA
ncbi:hypothetical protein K470DRAFT_283372 [Piedraia hortae CBS 480.64]|uniref:NADH:ubiquinone oxidoreductase 20.1kD subunit n=1 Tax=Piedraia hortae CBS 480.64 TaxID=1314780 RepID=A0A6A7BU53_9PEZI|nr:hypothetical protein K470DRAFT_283372 [Piedraia hortae CBS 480.64]